MRRILASVVLLLALSVPACAVLRPGTTELPPTATPAATEPATTEPSPTAAPATEPPTAQAPTATARAKDTPPTEPPTAEAPTATARVEDTPPTVAPTTAPTPTPIVMCTPPACSEGEVYYCEGECPGGCGTQCATPTAGPPSPPSILSFTADRTAIVQGESVNLTWQATGGTEAYIGWYSVNALPVSGVGPLDPDGGIVAVKPESSPIYLVVMNSAGVAEAQVHITIQCAHEWVSALSEHPPSDGCPGEAQIGAAAQQPFENGFMIWLEPSRTIYVFYNFGRAGSPPVYEVYPDNFQEGDPESDPAIVPPAGLYQPIRGFGLVWRTHPDVREGLGWATAPEVGFQTWRQGYTGSGMHASFTLMQGIDGTIYHLEAFGSTWEVYSP